MLRQSRIAWQGVSVSPSQITHLPRQVHHPQPTRHFQPVVAIPNRRPSLLLAKTPDQHFVAQPPLLNQQGAHRFPSNFHHVIFQSVQVMFRPYTARLHHRHGSPPHFGERFRIVKIINTPYHQYQLAHIRSPDVRLSAQCRHRGYSYGPILIKGASHHFGALTKVITFWLGYGERFSCSKGSGSIPRCCHLRLSRRSKHTCRHRLDARTSLARRSPLCRETGSCWPKGSALPRRGTQSRSRRTR